MAGKPVIHATNAGNDPVAEARAGITVPPYDPQELDKALLQFCEMSEEQRTNMGKNGTDYALKNLEWNLLAEKYNEIFTTLLSLP